MKALSGQVDTRCNDKQEERPYTAYDQLTFG